MDVVSAGAWRFPDAEAVLDEGVWWVALLGEGELVRPRGVRADDHFDDEPEVLPETLHEVYEDLRLVAVQPDHGDAADHLAQHIRRFGVPELCGHGLPMWHSDRTDVSRGCTAGRLPDGRVGVRVDHVAAMVTTLDAIGQAYEYLTAHGAMPGRRAIDHLLAWPVQASALRSPAAVRHSDAAVAKRLLRGLVTRTLDAALRASGGYIGTAWREQRRPELVLFAQTTVSLYVADTLAHVGFIAPDRTLVCAFCGQPFTPKRPPRSEDTLCCRRPECQRERTRRNVARSRARGRA